MSLIEGDILMFSGKYPFLRDFPIQKGWSVHRGEHQGHPLFVRFNAAAKPFERHPELPYRLGIAVPFLQPNEHGLPRKEEAGALDAIEDALCDALQPSALGFLVAVVTTTGMREFMFYISAREHVAAALQAASKRARGHQLQHYVKEDKQWDAYRQFAQ